MKKWLWCLLVAGLLCTAGAALGEGFGVWYQATDSQDTAVLPQEKDGQMYLLLPACADLAALPLYTQAQGAVSVAADGGLTAAFESGEPVNIAALFASPPADGRYPVTFTSQWGDTLSLCVMASQNLCSVYLVSDDPENAGRAWVDGSQHHETEATGRVTVLRADGTALYAGAMEKIRGRGNSSWGNYPLTAELCSVVDKKPYQLTLARKADLLDTGLPEEANKRWILLAEYYDGTLLHNRISYDLARELGQSSAPGCTSVDLYYDGAYRGQYLLCEKVEVAQGRVEGTGYGSILKKLNQQFGVDVEQQPQVTGDGAQGTALAATANVQDGGQYTLGTYLVELDNQYYAAERAYFCLTSGKYYTLRDPQYASLDMVAYVRDRFEQIDRALANYGVDPDTGALWSDLLDADSVLPYYWVNALAKNPDAWGKSSTYFVLPAGGGKVSMGPVWDFDIAYYLRANEGFQVGDEQAAADMQANWATELARIPAFQTLAKAYFTQKVQPAVEGILLGGQQARGECLLSLRGYWAQTAASRAMNDVLWDPESVFGTEVAATYEENFDALMAFVRQRYAWLAQDTAAWAENEAAEALAITLRAPYGNVEGQAEAEVDDLHTVARQASLELTQCTQATESSFALWEACLTVAPKPGAAFAAGVTVTVNGTPVPCVRGEDGALTVTVRFYDPSYRPAEYEDTDYGLVFDAQYYAAHCPEAAAAAGGDAQALLAYYVNTGIGAFDQANAFFDPAAVMAQAPEIADLYGDGGDAPVQYFLDGGYEDLMSMMGQWFTPEVDVAQE